MNNYISNKLTTELMIIKQKPPQTDSVNCPRQNCFRIIGNNVDVGQGCIFVGAPQQTLSSYGFETCSPLIMLSHNNGKNVLGHIDSATNPLEIVKIIQTNFAPKEIEKAEFHYMKGAESYSNHKNLCYYATNTIEDALKILGVSGKRHDILKTGLESVIVNAQGLFIQEGKKLTKLV